MHVRRHDDKGVDAQVFLAIAEGQTVGNDLGTCLAGLFTSCTLFRTDEVAENPGDFAAYT
jgi:hypothetical protein